MDGVEIYTSISAANTAPANSTEKLATYLPKGWKIESVGRLENNLYKMDKEKSIDNVPAIRYIGMAIIFCGAMDNEAKIKPSKPS